MDFPGPSAHSSAGDRSRAEHPEPGPIRPQGLATLATVSSRQRRAGSFSHRRRSWASPFGAFSSRSEARDGVSARDDPPAVSPLIAPRRRAARAGLRGRGFRVFGPLRESLARRDAFGGRRAGCSLGLHPLQGVRAKTWPRRPSASSRTLRGARPSSRPPASQSLNRPSLGRHRIRS